MHRGAKTGLEYCFAGLHRLRTSFLVDLIPNITVIILVLLNPNTPCDFLGQNLNLLKYGQ